MMIFLGETLSFLFSTIITLYTLIFLYLPSLFLQFINFSPVILSTLILLLYLLRLGATQNGHNYPTQSPPPQQIQDNVFDDAAQHELCSSYAEPEPEPEPSRTCSDSFREWHVRAPLEVIYEEYEGEDAPDRESAEMDIIRRYAPLSLFYPESDSDASSEGMNGDCWDSPENMCFRWEDDDDREGLIEIALDQKRNAAAEVDEDNLIEIDISFAR